MMEMGQHILSYLKRPPVKGGKQSMDQEEIKHRYGFAMCAFSRMYGPKTVNGSTGIHKFCHQWAESEMPTPTGTLVSINFYFKDLWDVWGRE
tara:strand:- start:120 stop:395 length:276 start_codon:yes stop_codon:yes gene_type:complete